MTNTARTPDEIVERLRHLLEKRQDRDPWGMQCSVLRDCLPYDKAMEWQRKDQEISAAEWEEQQRIKNPEALLQELIPDMWNDANSNSLLSVRKKMGAARGLLFVIGRQDLVEEFQDQGAEDFDAYGKPYLVRLSNEFGVDWKPKYDAEGKLDPESIDNGEWVFVDYEKPEQDPVRLPWEKGLAEVGLA